MSPQKAKGRMFKSVGWTLNPVVGCSHRCGASEEHPDGYCFACRFHKRRRAARPFTEPALKELVLRAKLPDDGSIVFVCSAGDLFCSAVPDEWITRVLERIRLYKGSCRFLLQTKNPQRLHGFLPLMTPRSRFVVGTTLETNRSLDYPLCTAPGPARRFWALALLPDDLSRFVSLEPLADFDVEELAAWVKSLKPIAVEVGLENYGSVLPRPPLAKVQDLYDRLTGAGLTVVLKDNLAGKIKETGG